jgi:tRNA dimethylallyltransferase
MEKAKQKIIVVCGPTGIGKTSTAIKLARDLRAEIVSADSMQVYRHMDIGTAKPTAKERACVPHHMIDMVNPDEHFDAACFAESARKVIKNLHIRGTLPLVVGGSGLYIKSLIHGMFHVRIENQTARNRLKEDAAVHGTNFLYRQLQERDPESALKIHSHDSYRIIRALEVYQETGNSISTYHRKHRFGDMPFTVLKIGIEMDRATLYERINHRVDEMIHAGFLDEVKHLIDIGYSETLKSMQAIGYRHLVGYVMGRLSWEETLRTLKRDTRRFAKRQLTWFRGDSEIVWYGPERLKDMGQCISSFLEAG